jgi:hypothetical protein
MRLTSNIASRGLGMLCLSIWLILTGVLPLFSVRVSPTLSTIMSVLAVAAGLLLLLGR